MYAETLKQFCRWQLNKLKQNKVLFAKLSNFFYFHHQAKEIHGTEHTEHNELVKLGSNGLHFKNIDLIQQSINQNHP